MSWGVGVKNLTARIAPDMLGSKMGTKMVPVRVLNAQSTILRAKSADLQSRFRRVQ